MQPGEKKLIADKIGAGMDAAIVAANPSKFSWRLKPSNLGDDCVARLWYDFRWTTLEQHDARMIRLFKRGHKTEADLSDYLRASGWEVRDYAQRLVYYGENTMNARYELRDWSEPLAETEIDATLDRHHVIAAAADGIKLGQFRATDFDGHLSTYIDGIGRHPDYFGGQWVMLEYKTYNTKRFVELSSKGVALNDPKYLGQVVMCLEYFKLDYCLFVAINKNDDDLYHEVIERNTGKARDLWQTAHTVLTSPVRPARLSEQPTHYKCKFCPHIETCHYDKAPIVSCRSCVNVVPIMGGKFACKLYGPIPGETEIRAACGNYKRAF